MNSAKKPPRNLPANYVLNGDNAEVRHLVYHCDSSKNGKVIVFVDQALDLDWECDDKAEELNSTEPRRTAVRETTNAVAAIEPLVHSWPDDLKLTSKRLLGEAIASALCGDSEGANKALQHARSFVAKKSKQVSRYWTLQGCVVGGMLAAVCGLLEIILRADAIGYLGMTGFQLSLSFWAGCVGALLFVTLRLGRQTAVDSTAERHLHYWESVARVVAGGFAGVLFAGMVKLGLILPVFLQAGLETLAMCVAAMGAGASERLAAGIVTKIETQQSINPETENAPN